MKQFRGISDVYVAKVLTDTVEKYETDEPVRLCYAAKVGKEVSSDSASIFLDNKAMAVINSEGADELTIEGSALDLDVLALITGKKYIAEKDMFIDGERTVDKFALGYKEKMTDGSYRFNWRFAVTFAIPSEESNTEDDGTDSVGQTVNATGVFCNHVFAANDNKPAKGFVCTDAKVETSDWFTEVKTPDTVELKAVSQ